MATTTNVNIFPSFYPSVFCCFYVVAFVFHILIKCHCFFFSFVSVFTLYKTIDVRVKSLEMFGKFLFILLKNVCLRELYIRENCESLFNGVLLFVFSNNFFLFYFILPHQYTTPHHACEETKMVYCIYNIQKIEVWYYSSFKNKLN